MWLLLLGSGVEGKGCFHPLPWTRACCVCFLPLCFASGLWLHAACLCERVQMELDGSGWNSHSLLRCLADAKRPKPRGSSARESRRPLCAVLTLPAGGVGGRPRVRITYQGTPLFHVPPCMPTSRMRVRLRGQRLAGEQQSSRSCSRLRVTFLGLMWACRRCACSASRIGSKRTPACSNLLALLSLAVS